MAMLEWPGQPEKSSFESKSLGSGSQKELDAVFASYFHKGLKCQNGEIELYTSN